MPTWAGFFQPWAKTDIDPEVVKTQWMPKIFMGLFIFALIAAFVFMFRAIRQKDSGESEIQNKALTLSCLVAAVFSLFMIRFYTGADNGITDVLPVIEHVEVEPLDMFDFADVCDEELTDEYSYYFSWVSIVESGDKLIITVHDDTDSANAKLAVSGNEKAQNEWKETREKFLNVYDVIRDLAKKHSIDLSDIIFALVDDRDTTHYLLGARDGELVTDVVEGKGLPSDDDVSDRKKEAAELAADYLNFSTFSYKEMIRQLEYEGYMEDEAIYGADHCNADWKDNAVRKARSFLENVGGYSYDGLVNILEFVGYTHEEAIYGADNCEADWNEQALQYALDSLEYYAYSETVLKERLDSEGFTPEQMEYAVRNCGADWYEQAARMAEISLKYSSYTREEMIDELETYYGFTHDQAVYGAEQNGY